MVQHKFLIFDQVIHCTSVRPIVGRRYFHPVVGQDLFCKKGDEDDCVFVLFFWIIVYYCLEYVPIYFINVVIGNLVLG